MAEQKSGHLKGSLLGGFDRKSVADCMEKLIRERNGYRDRLEACEQKCEELESALKVQQELNSGERLLTPEQERDLVENAVQAERTRASQAETDLHTMAGRLHEVYGQLKARNEELEALRAQLAEAREQLETSRADRARTEEKQREELRALREKTASVMDDLRRQMEELDVRLTPAEGQGE